MPPAQEKLHMSVGVLFAVAAVLYLLGGIIPAILLGVLGAIVEMAAWITWIVAASRRGDSNR
jgi:uncharacterized membrane protein